MIISLNVTFALETSYHCTDRLPNIHPTKYVKMKITVFEQLWRKSKARLIIIKLGLQSQL